MSQRSHTQKNNSSKSECPICFSKTVLKRIPSCNHQICYNCLESWFRVSSQCPICRDLCDPRRILDNKKYNQELRGEGRPLRKAYLDSLKKIKFLSIKA